MRSTALALLAVVMVTADQFLWVVDAPFRVPSGAYISSPSIPTAICTRPRPTAGGRRSSSRSRAPIGRG